MRTIKFLFFLLIICVFLFNTKDKPQAVTSTKNNILSYDYLYNNVIRFHFIANSDSEFDQMVKNKMKDNVLGYLKEKERFGNSKTQNIDILNKNLHNIKTICKNVLEEYGLDYELDIEIDKKYFEERVYGKYIVPSGVYDSFVVHIGESSGRNFWSMLFTSIGFIDSDDSHELDSMVKVVKNKRRNVIPVSGGMNSNNINISFKIFDIMKNLFQKIF